MRGFTSLGIVMGLLGVVLCAEAKPNVVFVLADQWRAQATTWEKDPNLLGKTPVLDKLAGESVNFKYAISCTPVCTPYRGSLLTGQYPLKHGLIINDVNLNSNAVSIAEAFAAGGYDTAYIGKWHVDGRGRSAYIPKERRQGFDYWKVLECTHDYNHSAYYAQEDTTKRFWPEYDAFAQTKDAQAYVASRKKADKPFLLVLSWGPPHNPYPTAPQAYQLFDPEKLVLRKNTKDTPAFRKDLAGYYAHIVALDKALGDFLKTLDDKGLREETVVVFTSDHGDMLGSQDGETRKQRPWDEAIRVPLLLRYPAAVKAGRVSELMINTPDLMPTLLGLCGVDIPPSVAGENYAPVVRGEQPEPADGAALIACYTPFGEWTRAKGGREYRGVRTKRYTYVRSLEGPWLLYDNVADPYQLENKVADPGCRAVREKLEAELGRLLKKTNDEFRPGEEYIRKWGYKVDRSGTAPYK